MSPGESSTGLKQFARLFLSVEDSRDSREGVISESLVWIMVTGNSPMRAFLASGLSVCIARKNINVTLVETGRGLPNAGYYFAFEPEEYLLPVLEEKKLLKRSVSDSLRFIYARTPSLLEPFEEKFARNNEPHIIIEAFDFLQGGRTDYWEEFLRISAFYSLNYGNNRLVPDVIIVVNSGDSLQKAGLFDSIVELAPEATFFTDVEISEELTGRIDATRLNILAGMDISFGRRLPPSGPFFSGFTNTLLQKIGSKWKGK
jgi:hypothetical protein